MQYAVVQLNSENEPARVVGPFYTKDAALADAVRLWRNWADEWLVPHDDVQQWLQNDGYGCGVFHSDGTNTQAFYVTELEMKP